MKLRKLDPNLIKIPEVRVTAQFEPAELSMFKASIKNAGMIAPIIVCEIDGDVVLVDGLHRLSEAIDNKQKTIAAVVIPGDMVDVLTKNIFIDHMRGRPPITEMITVIKALFEEYKVTIEGIVDKTGMTRDYVEKLLKLSELTPYCLAVLDEGRIGVGHAAALTKLKDPIRQETVLQQQLLYRWKVPELENYVKEVEAIVEEQAPADTQTKEREPIKVKCVYCQQSYDVHVIANPNTCSGCAGVMFGSIAQAKVEMDKEIKDDLKR